MRENAKSVDPAASDVYVRGLEVYVVLDLNTTLFENIDSDLICVQDANACSNL